MPVKDLNLSDTHCEISEANGDERAGKAHVYKQPGKFKIDITSLRDADRPGQAHKDVGALMPASCRMSLSNVDAELCIIYGFVFSNIQDELAY